MQLTPTQKGLATGIAVVAVLAGILAFALAVLLATPPQASPGLLRNLGQAGIGLLIAYSVVVAGGERTLSERSRRDEHLDWLGFVVGLGVCGLTGVGLAFGVAEHRLAGHENLIDWLGLWWAVSSIGFLGIVVALQPLMIYEWRSHPPRRRWRVERVRSEASRSRRPAA